jgi:septal ring factor EnvC (AmiA/AmiB activator)
MNPEIVNMYIARLIKEIEELTKNRLLVETQLQYTEKLNAELQAQLKQTEAEIEKNNKKINKKEVNTSDTF